MLWCSSLFYEARISIDHLAYCPIRTAFKALKAVLFSAGTSSSVTAKNSRKDVGISRALQILSIDSREGKDSFFSIEHNALAERPHF